MLLRMTFYSLSDILYTILMMIMTTMSIQIHHRRYIIRGSYGRRSHPCHPRQHGGYMGVDCGGFYWGTNLIETVVDRFGNRQ